MKNDIMSKLYNLFLIIVLFTLPVTEGLKTNFTHTFCFS